MKIAERILYLFGGGLMLSILFSPALFSIGNSKAWTEGTGNWMLVGWVCVSIALTMTYLRLKR